MADYVDLRIAENDLTLDSGKEATYITDRDCIVQDIKHCIRDSGLMVEIVGQRDNAKVALNLQKLELLIEEDVRLVPGTVAVTRSATELFFIAAITVNYGPINFEVTA